MGWLLQVQVSKLRFKLEVTLGRESVCILILQVRTKEILAGELEWISTIEDEVFVHPACQEFAGKGKPMSTDDAGWQEYKFNNVIYLFRIISYDKLGY